MKNNILLEVAFPQWAKQWHSTKNPKSVSDVMAGSQVLAWWFNEECQHEWSAKIDIRTRSSTSCWVCSGKRILAGFNDLTTLFPAIGSEWHPTLNGDWLPTQIGGKSSKRAHWLGACGHDWRASISSRTAGNHGCPVCAGRQLLTGFNDLLTRYPLVSAEWHPHKNGILLPETTLHGTHTKVWWQCSRGHEWEANVVARTRPVGVRLGGAGCPYCSGRLAIVGENDLCTTHPELSLEWHPTLNGDFAPYETKAGSQKRVWWLGRKCKHEYKAKIAHRATEKSGCPYCSGNKLLVDFNDIATTHPDVAVEWHPSKNKRTPQDYTRGNKTLVWWLCPVGHEYRCTPNNRTSPNGSGCPDCAAAAMSDGTSAVELATFEAIASIFSDAVHGARVDRTLAGRRSWALDIYVPSIGLVVEYDGQAWHCTCCSPWDVEDGLLESRDRAKTQNLQDMGYRVIRIRTPHMGVITSDDLLVGMRDRGPVVAAAVLAHLRMLGLMPETVGV